MKARVKARMPKAALASVKCCCRGALLNSEICVDLGYCDGSGGRGWRGAAPPGCICPPTSEKTCQSPICPRRPMTGRPVTTC
jgi:hypothetical protein